MPDIKIFFFPSAAGVPVLSAAPVWPPRRVASGAAHSTRQPSRRASYKRLPPGQATRASSPPRGELPEEAFLAPDAGGSSLRTRPGTPAGTASNTPGRTETFATPGPPPVPRWGFHYGRALLARIFFPRVGFRRTDTASCSVALFLNQAAIDTDTRTRPPAVARGPVTISKWRRHARHKDPFRSNVPRAEPREPCFSWRGPGGTYGCLPALYSGPVRERARRTISRRASGGGSDVSSGA